MTKHKGLYFGILLGFVTFTSFVTFFGAMVAMEWAHNTVALMQQIFSFDSTSTAHLTTDIIFLSLAIMALVFALKRNGNPGLTYFLLIAFMMAIYVFGSDLLYQLALMSSKNADGQFGMVIFEMVTWTSPVYPIVGFIYDRRQGQAKTTINV